jgi:hypothetical protein
MAMLCACAMLLHAIATAIANKDFNIKIPLIWLDNELALGRANSVGYHFPCAGIILFKFNGYNLSFGLQPPLHPLKTMEQK